MLSIDVDWRRQIDHGGEVTTTHVALIGLNKARLLVASCTQTYAIVEEAAVAASCSVFDGIIALRPREL